MTTDVVSAWRKKAAVERSIRQALWLLDPDATVADALEAAVQHLPVTDDPSEKMVLRDFAFAAPDDWSFKLRYEEVTT